MSGWSWRRRRPRQEMTLDEFWLACYPVTYGEWKAFLDDTGHDWIGTWWRIVAPPRGWLRRFCTMPAVSQEMAGYPIVDVTQEDAFAYCGWLSQRLGLHCTLPDEFQWEKAARCRWSHLSMGRNAAPEMADLQATHAGPRLLPAQPAGQVKVEAARSGWYWRIGAPASGRNPTECFALWLL